MVVQVVDDGIAVDVLVTPQATSSVHGSEKIVAELLLVTDEAGYG